MNKNFLIVILLLIVVGCATKPFKTSNIDVQILLNLHNKERALKDRVNLQFDSYLSQYAQDHAEYMAKRNRLVHSDISVLSGKYSRTGENIAWNQQTEEDVVDAWMSSYGHRTNILNKNFTKVGFGVALAKDNSIYWCAVFGN